MYQKISLQNFTIISTIDSTHNNNIKILLCRNLEEEIIILKEISKQYLLTNNLIQHIQNEKQSLLYFTNIIHHKHINSILGTFHNQINLYMILKPVLGLPLHKLLLITKTFNMKFTKLIITQIGLILLDIHSKGFIYRDIKASNFIIDSKGFVTLIDMGLSKRIKNNRTYTICGTSHAIPPEIYKKKGYSYQFDYYSYGILIYELLCGQAPFGYQNTNINLQQGINEIMLNKISCMNVQDLIKQLLSPIQTQRLGYKNGFTEILSHDWFNGQDFIEIKDIYDGNATINTNQYAEYINEIQDIGIDIDKYKEISKDDPFYKFN